MSKGVIKKQLEMEENGYNVKKHKELVTKELKERGYPDNVIKVWTDFIE